MKALVVAEHHHGKLATSTRACITAGLKLSSHLDLLLCGTDLSSLLKEAVALPGVRHVICVDQPDFAHCLAESMSHVIHSICSDYDAVLMPATTFGKNCLPRAAALSDSQPITDIIEILNPTTFKRPIYAGNAVVTLETHQKKLFLTIRPTSFDPCPQTGGSASAEHRTISIPVTLSSFVSFEGSPSDRPELGDAEIVISGGRGLQSKENFKLLEDLAAKLGAAVGASRAAVDAGFVPNDYQVGQTGKVVSPKLYIAVGISGAIQHLAGMKDSKIIVAINKDENAPIFKIADYGLVQDLFKAVPDLIQELEKQGK